MEFKFSNSASSKQLLIRVKELDFFQKIKDNNIQLSTRPKYITYFNTMSLP